MFSRGSENRINRRDRSDSWTRMPPLWLSTCDGLAVLGPARTDGACGDVNVLASPDSARPHRFTGGMGYELFVRLLCPAKKDR